MKSLRVVFRLVLTAWLCFAVLAGLPGCSNVRYLQGVLPIPDPLAMKLPVQPQPSLTAQEWTCFRALLSPAIPWSRRSPCLSNSGTTLPSVATATTDCGSRRRADNPGSGGAKEEEAAVARQEPRDFSLLGTDLDSNSIGLHPDDSG